jgi:lipoate---protein ligase
MWRVVGLSTHDAAENMAIDESVGEHVAEGLSPPTIRFYSWKPRAVTIGRYQRADLEVDVRLCGRYGIDFARRNTGGGAVYHNGEITYSLIAPENFFSRDIRSSFREICSSVIKALDILGIEGEFKPLNDIVVNGRKISGNAQIRRRGVLTQHGTVLFTLDREKMFSLLTPPTDKLAAKGRASFAETVTCTSEEGCSSKEDLYKAMLLGFTSGREWSFGDMSPSEKELTGVLACKYKSKEWNYSI